MDQLTLARAARGALRYGQQQENVTGENLTLFKYLCMLASKHPEKVSFEELVDKLEVNKSQVSRCTRALHKLAHTGQPGKDLIDVEFDIRNPRLKLVSLNDGGLKAVSSLVKPWAQQGA